MPRNLKKTTIQADGTPPPAADPPVCETPSDEASAYGTWFALHDAGCTVGAFRRKSQSPAVEQLASAAS